jgi:hypothetical protein
VKPVQRAKDSRTQDPARLPNWKSSDPSRPVERWFSPLTNNIGDKAIAQCGHCLDISGLFGVVGQKLAHLPDCPVQDVVGNKGSVPNGVNQLAPTDHAAGILNQKNQQIQRFRLDWYGLASLQEAESLEVDFDIVKPVNPSHRKTSAFR